MADVGEMAEEEDDDEEEDEEDGAALIEGLRQSQGAAALGVAHEPLLKEMSNYIEDLQSWRRHREEKIKAHADAENHPSSDEAGFSTSPGLGQARAPPRVGGKARAGADAAGADPAALLAEDLTFDMGAFESASEVLERAKARGQALEAKMLELRHTMDDTGDVAGAMPSAAEAVPETHAGLPLKSPRFDDVEAELMKLRLQHGLGLGVMAKASGDIWMANNVGLPPGGAAAGAGGLGGAGDGEGISGGGGAYANAAGLGAEDEAMLEEGLGLWGDAQSLNYALEGFNGEIDALLRKLDDLDGAAGEDALRSARRREADASSSSSDSDEEADVSVDAGVAEEKDELDAAIAEHKTGAGVD
uniref:Uncharacterized protein n=1 Tax=Phaeomonas parva TaxID=124430 RepID=A0A7S1UK31_9STRA|mmetsp:Transcript_9239/g.27084  ORF Transcript_9239/g.27084 Transcript_9239/m.27084 type:complete len:360 (+) Transcript_9239:2-1081(+)